MKSKIISNVLFWLTLASPMISFSLVCMIGESNVFGVLGMVRYSWVMLLFIPIGILSLVVGIILKKQNQKYKKNLIIAFICIPLLVIFGSYRFLMTDVITYDTNKLDTIEQRINTELPDEVKIATLSTEAYNISYVKITDSAEVKRFEDALKSSDVWKTKLAAEIQVALPMDMQFEMSSFDYFLFYDQTDNIHNVYPSSGEHNCIFISYDSQAKSLIILDNFKVSVEFE